MIKKAFYAKQKDKVYGPQMNPNIRKEKKKYESGKV